MAVGVYWRTVPALHIFTVGCTGVIATRACAGAGTRRWNSSHNNGTNAWFDLWSICIMICKVSFAIFCFMLEYRLSYHVVLHMLNQPMHVYPLYIGVGSYPGDQL